MKKENYNKNEIRKLEKHWSKYNNLKLSEASLDNKFKYYWKCSKYVEEHRFLRSIKSFMNSSNCPYCSNRKVLSGFNDLKTLYPHIAKNFNEEANGTKAYFIHSGEKNIKRIWFCEKGHLREREVYDEVRKNGRCPYCHGDQFLSGFNDLQTMHPELLSHWDYEKNNELKIYPNEISAKYYQKVYWKCPECFHNFQRRVFHQTSGKLALCPNCPKELPTHKNVTANKFYKQLIINFENVLNVSSISRKSNIKLKWQCLNDAFHVFEKSPKEIENTNGSCSICGENMLEKLIENYLIEKNIVFEKHVKILDRKEIDFYLTDLRKGIEVNGEYWHSDDVGKNESYHEWKLDKALDKKIDLVFVWAHDVKKHSDELFSQLDSWLLNKSFHNNEEKSFKNNNFSFLLRTSSIYDVPCSHC